MWTRGKDKKELGKFEPSIYEGRNLVKTMGGFNTTQEADRAAESAQREPIFTPKSKLDQEMSDEEMLAELGF